ASPSDHLSRPETAPAGIDQEGGRGTPRSLSRLQVDHVKPQPHALRTAAHLWQAVEEVLAGI
ncbi:MAG: hypothetical protein ACREDL_16590, partial [Bradyrhizobium sp.]